MPWHLVAGALGDGGGCCRSAFSKDMDDGSAVA